MGELELLDRASPSSGGSTRAGLSEGVRSPLAGAGADFAQVAQQQQQQQNERQRRFTDDPLRSPRSEGGHGEGGISGHRFDPGRTVRAVAFSFFSVVVFGSIIALHVYSLYLGGSNLGEPCGARLAQWLIVQGCLGLTGTALLIVLSIPRSVSDPTASRRLLSTHRIARPHLPTAEEATPTQRGLTGGLGFIQFVSLIWFCVGTAWVARDDRQECPARLRDFCFYLVISLWGIVASVFVLWFASAIIRRAIRLRRQKHSQARESTSASEARPTV